MTSPSELRKDPATGSWVIIAAERSLRPDDFRPSPGSSRPPERASGFCPFCAGHEAKTPPEVAAVREPGTPADGPGWRVRVVPNKFPALTRGETPPRRTRGLYESMPGVGVHEVVIESPDHLAEFPDLAPAHAADVLKTWRERILSIESEPQYEYVQVFKNKGREAGASLSHPHTQIVATPIIPKRLKEEIYGAERFFGRRKDCLFCRQVAQETGTGERLVQENAAFVALAPFAARFPFETHIFPRFHSPYFASTGDTEIAPLAEALQVVLGRLRERLSDPPYNLVLHPGPRPARSRESWPKLEAFFHWHIEILPVLTSIAGFEHGTGFYINPVPPEAAAAALRG